MNWLIALLDSHLEDLQKKRKYIRTIAILRNVVERLRELSPLWEMHLDGVDLDTVRVGYPLKYV